jgi:exopolysaccharide biosynthesis polyprenyl glycosylphosphotransferase
LDPDRVERVTRHQAAFFRRLIYVYDLVVSVVAFFVALSLRALLGRIGDWFPREIGAIDAGDYYSLLWGLLPLWFLSLYFSNTSDVRLGYGRAAARYLRAVAIGLALFVTASFAFKLGFVARTFVLLFGLVHFFALVIGRVVLVEVASRVRRQQVDGHRVLVVGTGSEAVAFTGSLRAEPPWNHHFVGFVRIPAGEGGEPTETPVESLPGPIIGELDELEAILDREPVDEVVFAVPDRPPEMLEQALLHCDARGVDVLLTMPPDIPKHGEVDMASITGYDLPLIGMRRTSTREGELLIKRMLDLLGGTVGVLLVSPILLFTALAIKLTDPGPIFFRQIRVGRNGRRFWMIKFRSMVVDAEARKRELMKHNEMGGPVFKMKADPRITKVGRFIRKTSIDELPQLFNVLWGHMSLVGPRPPLPDEVAQYKPWQRRRLSVKPGITGLWQVSGRNQVDFDEWMELDLRYIDNWSIWFDIEILLKTIPVVLLRKGAS